MMEYVWSTIDFLVMYLFALCFFKPRRRIGKRIDFIILIVVAVMASFINDYFANSDINLVVTAGLDPKERIRIRNLISDLSQDRIVLIATHVVSDIEFISKEILLMKNGRLIDKASPEQLQAKIQGKVFEMSVGQQELEEVKEKFEISNLFRKDGQIIVRVVTQKRPEGYDEIREAAPTLEDVYLYEFEVKGAMHNNAVRKIAGT